MGSHGLERALATIFWAKVISVNSVFLKRGREGPEREKEPSNWRLDGRIRLFSSAAFSQYQSLPYYSTRTSVAWVLNECVLPPTPYQLLQEGKRQTGVLWCTLGTVVSHSTHPLDPIPLRPCPVHYQWSLATPVSNCGHSLGRAIRDLQWKRCTVGERFRSLHLILGLAS